MRVLIAEDEPLSRRKIELILQNLPHINIVASVANGEEALAKIQKTPIDIAVLDIEMPLMNGMNLAEHLRANFHSEVIFVTAFDHYAVSAFDLESADYVLKPISKERLITALERARKRLIARALDRTLDYTGPGWHTAPLQTQPSEAHIYWAQTTKGQIRVPVDTVIRIEACKDYAYLHTGTRSLMVRETMANLEDEFKDHGFIRIHRSHIVQIDQVEAVESDGRRRLVVMSDGAQLPLGQSYRESLDHSLHNGAAS
ncbi:LytR/AlgR family response regulator transcription factor [Woodsholea maritima]|uniref:LytR/AlgR family response regulator transcription factor n=1 Tax=Woodsholea maritima TaxID=240237 RepID=UPI00037FED75|nr:LytTR family DNA-binding domain-containing protein [Woodsholea maritima]